MKAADRDDQATVNATWYPGIDAGIEGVRLLERCVESADNASKWVKYHE